MDLELRTEGKSKEGTREERHKISMAGWGA
jgi:hypothetical protein